MSATTAVGLLAAVVGAALVRALTDLPAPAALLAGATAGWLLATALLQPSAERLDRWLHRMGGPRRRRRRSRSRRPRGGS